VAFDSCDVCLFTHNTVVGLTGWAARILSGNPDTRIIPTADGVFVDNIIVWSGASSLADPPVNVGSGTDPASFTFGSNLWYREGGPTPEPIDPDGAGPIPTETGSVYGLDPRLVAGEEPAVQPTSPAAAAGRPVPGMHPADFHGICYGDPPAIGASAAR
jgi:hypothetical protein